MDYIIIRKNIKNFYIQIKDGKVYVKAPRKMPESEIAKLLKKKEEWIKKSVQNQETKAENSKQYLELLGEKYFIQFVPSNRECIEIEGSKAYLYTKEDTQKEREKLIKNLYKKYALKQYTATTEKMMQVTGLSPDSWKIRDIKSAWGSCSSKRAITLSLNLVQKREELIEYVVLHELCHLKHMNHSKDFWNLVGKYMPNYKACRKELKK
ncbi:MAG: M48 family metallopeptidase [Clostridia bacterium]|nr:M48 family metallopeptidase [Clostridia bacterium]